MSSLHRLRRSGRSFGPAGLVLMALAVPALLVPLVLLAVLFHLGRAVRALHRRRLGRRVLARVPTVG